MEIEDSIESDRELILNKMSIASLIGEIGRALNGWTESDDDSKVFYNDGVNSGWIGHSSDNLVLKNASIT